MKTDSYTKTILTVIALCLVYIVAKDVGVFPNANAQSGQVVDVNITKIAGAPISNHRLVQSDLPLPVTVK